MREMFEKLMPLYTELKRITPAGWTSFRIQDDGEAYLAHFPTEATSKEATLFLLRSFGKFEKDSSGNISATKDGITVRLFGVLKCEKVGTKIVQKEKVIYTGKMEDVEVPVYRCYSPLVEE